MRKRLVLGLLSILALAAVLSMAGPTSADTDRGHLLWAALQQGLVSGSAITACSDGKPEEVEYLTMSDLEGTPMDIIPTYLPPGAEEVDPMWPPVVCKGILASVDRQWIIRNKGVDIFIGRRQGEHAIATDASAERVSAGTVAGKPAVLIEPLTPEGYGYSSVIVAEDFGLTIVSAFGLPMEETVKIAEGVK